MLCFRLASLAVCRFSLQVLLGNVRKSSPSGRSEVRRANAGEARAIALADRSAHGGIDCFRGSALFVGGLSCLLWGCNYDTRIPLTATRGPWNHGFEVDNHRGRIALGAASLGRRGAQRTGEGCVLFWRTASRKKPKQTRYIYVISQVIWKKTQTCNSHPSPRCLFVRFHTLLFSVCPPNGPSSHARSAAVTQTNAAGPVRGGRVHPGRVRVPAGVLPRDRRQDR